MRQLQAGPNNSIPDTTLQQIHQHEATAVGSEKLFNSFTTQVADIKKDMDYLHSRLNTIEGDTRASHEKSRNFIHQASKLLLDYASDKGIEVCSKLQLTQSRVCISNHLLTGHVRQGSLRGQRCKSAA